MGLGHLSPPFPWQPPPSRKQRGARPIGCLAWRAVFEAKTLRFPRREGSLGLKDESALCGSSDKLRAADRITSQTPLELR